VTEVTVLATQEEIRRVGERIERAYYLRRGRNQWSGSTSGLWCVAATRLIQSHWNDPKIPVDPELYVAAQPIDARQSNPWFDLSQEVSVRRYCRHVRKIVRDLRAELRLEIRLAERRVRRGSDLEEVVSEGRNLSPLACYIVAHRAARFGIAERFQSSAEDQHWSCPLYREASLPWLSFDTYPIKGSSVGLRFSQPAWNTTADAARN
jgi:hypothetical protein